MYVSHETPEETDARLRRVIAAATLTWMPGTFAFEEFAIPELSARMRADALALVRDDEVWSQLVPSSDIGSELVGLVRFHFEPGLDNSGFVGWLAMHLKRTLGTGVFVVCGHNRSRGGIFDYCGYPAELSDEVSAEIDRLRR